MPSFRVESFEHSFRQRRHRLQSVVVSLLLLLNCRRAAASMACYVSSLILVLFYSQVNSASLPVLSEDDMCVNLFDFIPIHQTKA